MNHHTQCRYSVVPGSAHQLDADGDGRDEIYVAFVRMPDEHWASRQRRWFAVVPDARSRRVAELRPVPSVLFWNGNHVLLHGIDDPLRRVAANVLATGRPQPRAPRVDAGPCGDWNDYEVDVDGDGRVERLLLRTSGWEECQGHDDTLWLGDGRGRSTLIGTVSVDAFSGYRPGPTIELDAIGSRLARLDQCAVCDDELSMIELDAPRGGEARRGLATRRLSKHVRRMDEDTDRLLRRLAR